MNICSNCGACNESDRSTCFECGTPLGDASTQTRNSHAIRIPKAVLAIGGLITAAFVILGVVLGFSNRNSKVAKAFEHTMDTVIEEEQTKFHQFVSMADALLKDGDYSLYAAFSGGDADLELNADYSRSAKKIRGDLSVMDYDVEFSVKKKVIQIRFPGKYEVYGFKVDDVNKVLTRLRRIPLLSELLPAQLSANQKLDLFAKTNLKGVLDNIAGDEYRAFLDTVKVEKWNSETIAIRSQSQECRVYKISWKSAAANDLLGALASGGVLPNIGALVNGILPEMDPYVYCYINSENYMVGARFTAAGNDCFLLLEGAENPWDKVTLTMQSMTGEIRVYEGAVVRNNSEIRLYLKDGNQTVCTLDYDDTTGNFSFNTVSNGKLFGGQVISNQKEVGLRLNWMAQGMGSQEIIWMIGELEQEPEQLGEHYSDLATMAWSILESLLNDMLNN